MESLVRGIVMSEVSVVGILNGDKTETRRIRPLGNVSAGGILYVRETWKAAYQRKRDDALQVLYKADGRLVWLPIPSDKTVPLRDMWRPGRFMFKFMARFWLQVESVTCQRLQDIDDAAAIREGIFQDTGSFWYACIDGPGHGSPVDAYASLWDSMYLPRRLDLAWLKNPLVWAYRFAVIREDPYDLIAKVE